jgi:hypothetical protein
MGSTRTCSLKSGLGGARGGGKAPDILNIDNIRRVDSFTIHLVYCFPTVQWIGYKWDGVKIPLQCPDWFRGRPTMIPNGWQELALRGWKLSLTVSAEMYERKQMHLNSAKGFNASCLINYVLGLYRTLYVRVREGGCALEVLCWCFGNMCTCIYSVFVLFLLCIFILICYLCKDYCHRVKTQLQ